MLLSQALCLQMLEAPGDIVHMIRCILDGRPERIQALLEMVRVALDKGVGDGIRWSC